jgi:hypothetical protein
MSARLPALGITHCSPSANPKTGPLMPTAAPVTSATSSAGSPAGMIRVVMSRSVMKNIAATA